MLTTAQMKTLGAADAKCRAAIDAAESAASRTGLLNGDSIQRAALANVKTSRNGYAQARERLTGYIEAATFPTDAQVKALTEWYGVIGGFEALNSAVAATSASAAVVGTVKDSAAQLVNPLAWPAWMKLGAGGNRTAVARAVGNHSAHVTCGCDFARLDHYFARAAPWRGTGIHRQHIPQRGEHAPRARVLGVRAHTIAQRSRAHRHRDRRAMAMIHSA